MSHASIGVGGEGVEEACRGASGSDCVVLTCVCGYQNKMCEFFDVDKTSTVVAQVVITMVLVPRYAPTPHRGLSRP